MESEDDDDHLQTFPTPPPIGTTTSMIDKEKARMSMMNFMARKAENERSQNFQIFKEQDIVNNGNSNANPYAQKKKRRNESNTRTEAKKAKDEEDSQIIAGIPDTSDSCFRRYENSIIVNAQPYERRSSTGLIHCKSHCLNSQSGVYSCRSFVYDNINMVCDLFSHVGDQAPARLLKFQTRDYYEPTNAVQCLFLVQPPSNPSLPTAVPPASLDFGSNTDSISNPESSEFGAPPSPPVIEQAVVHATNIQQHDDENSFVSNTTPFPEIVKTQFKKEVQDNQCANGKAVTFLRTEGFELFKHDEEQVRVDDVSECGTLCASNLINNHEIACKSFDYLSSTSTCAFTSEAAVPVGNGQLKQREDAFYHEKICVSQSFVNNCPNSFFSRHPQMILVGFAESVSDSPDFEHCFDTCLNSFQLFGFNCTSGMYYFEESQLNCILNSENRNTQKELFTEENTDIVDYFEVECKKHQKAKHLNRKMAGVRNFETEAIGAERMLIDEIKQEREEDNGSRWEKWSECIEGKQTRRRSCTDFNKIEDCAEEVRDCSEDTASIKMSIRKSGIRKEKTTTEATTRENESEEADTDAIPTKEEIAEVKRTIRRDGFKCPLNTCCRVFLSCSYGLRHNSKTKQLEWCKRPCRSNENSNTRRRARLLR